uniref:F-box domain-containing protein n=1 Tax=Caenorhabditis tropicalis TaxID=1561998 RepID=A0A1I7T3M5_9PELO
MNISSNLNPVFRDPDKFSLLTIPDVARVYVIRLMDPKEQVRLALSTKKMENYIRISNIRYFDYGEVSLEENDFDIQVNHGRIPSENSQMTFRTKVQFNKKVMKPWFNEDSSVAEQAITVFKRLQATFHCEETGITFNINTPAIIRNVLDALDNLVFVALGKNNTTVETLNTIMEPYKRKREISVFASEMPLDYYHPNRKKVLGDQPENQGVQDEIRQLDEKLAKKWSFLCGWNTSCRRCFLCGTTGSIR